MPLVKKVRRDRERKCDQPKGGSFPFQFLILDFMILTAALKRELDPVQIIESIGELHGPKAIPSLSTIRTRLSSLSHEGFLAVRYDISRRRAYFSLTDLGKDRLYEMCKQAPVLNEMAKAAIAELAEHILVRRRPRSGFERGSTV